MIGIDFVEKYFHILEKNFKRILSQSETPELLIIRMIGNFQLHHMVLRRYHKHKEILTYLHFIEVISHFKKYCIEKDYSKVITDHYVKQSARFMDYLSSLGINSCKKIALTVINDYIKTLADCTYKTVEQNICSL